MAEYEGVPERSGRGGFTVLRDDALLDPKYSQAVWNHSPDGFNWGYEGSGPAQLALALLLEETGREEAVRYHQDFKRDVVARMPKDKRWYLTSEAIQKWLAERRGR